MGFECVRDLPGLGPDLLLLPLPGHTPAHCAVAVRTPEGWLLHCSDAPFYHGEIDLAGRRCTLGLELFQRIVQVDGEVRNRNQERQRQFARDHGAKVRVLCAHDPTERDRFAGA